MNRAEFVIYGVKIRIQGESSIEDLLRKDFTPFIKDFSGQGDVEIVLRLETPEVADFPELTSGNIQERCTVYSQGNVRWVDYYNGQAVSRWHFGTESGFIVSAELALLHELAYLILLSRVGEILDRRGVHRIHAAGLKVGNKGLLCMMPSGGGKTTLTLGAMRNPRVAMLSDDTPLVRRDGKILAFPTRIGCCAPPDGIRAEHLWEFNRREHGKKYLISPEAFHDQIAQEAEPGILMMGVRKLSGKCRIYPASKAKVYGALFSSLVVGIGLPQLIEYFVRFDVGDMARKAVLTASRIWTSLVLALRSQTFIIELGPDVEDNLREFNVFLSQVETSFRSGLSPKQMVEVHG